MKDTKPLSTKEYLSRFSLAARWYLGAKDAPEIIADYQEMLACEADSPQTPQQRFGPPLHAARMLSEEKPYRRWLWTFAVMAFGTVWMMVGLFADGPHLMFQRSGLFDQPMLTVALGFALGMALCGPVRRFPRGGTSAKHLAGALAALVLAGGAIAAVILSYCYTLIQRLRGEREIPIQDIDAMERVMYAVIQCGGTALTVAAIAALAAARCFDRRWRAAYVLALTIITALAAFLAMFRMLHSPETFWGDFAEWTVPVMLIGLIGTGVALC